MGARVQRCQDRVWLEGVRGWSFRQRRSSVHAAQEALMHALDEQISYSYLVGVSGLAFRMQLSKGGFCPSSPHPSCGYRSVARSTAALPWNMRFFSGTADGDPEIRKAIVDSIGRGVPVQYGTEEDGIIVGYEKNGEAWLCFHPQRDAGVRMSVETTLGWGVAIPGERKTAPPDRRALAEGALEQAVQMAVAGEAGGYFVGFRAWEEYIARLNMLTGSGDQASEEAFAGNAWIYACLAEHRACAATYLREIATEFLTSAANHLQEAADLYETTSGVLTGAASGADSVVPNLFSFSEADRFRSEQIRRLPDALVFERKAVGALERALTR